MLSSGSFKCFAYFRSDRLALGEFAQNLRKSRIRRDDKKNWLWLVFLAVLIHFGNLPSYKRPAATRKRQLRVSTRTPTISRSELANLRQVYSPTNTESTAYLT